MHELSIAMNILEVAQEEARKHAARVAAIHLRLGPLSGVVKEALLAAYELAAEASPLAGARLIIEEVPVLVYCPNCRESREPPSLQRFACPVCETPTAEVVQGAGLQLTALEVEE